MILVSACLAGINCRYDGKNNIEQKVVKLVEEGKAFPICPEQLGGLPTPRSPAEISGKKVIDINGNDVTQKFVKGATETLKIAELLNCKKAILKQNSPSCGYGRIYDGSHSDKIISGNGLTSDILSNHNITILTEEDI